METAPLSKHSISFGLALAIACIVNALIVVVKEKSPVVMNTMKITGHHWMTHAVIVLAVFGLCGWIFGKANGGQGITIPGGWLISALVSGVFIAGLIITGFYILFD